jgi:hypothetical protein
LRFLSARDIPNHYLTRRRHIDALTIRRRFDGLGKSANALPFSLSAMESFSAIFVFIELQPTTRVRSPSPQAHGIAFHAGPGKTCPSSLRTAVTRSLAADKAVPFNSWPVSTSHRLILPSAIAISVRPSALNLKGRVIELTPIDGIELSS